MPKKLDRLTDIDYQIFAKAAIDINYFTDWYFRSPTSGTRYDRSNPDSRITKIWAELHDQWKDAEAPEKEWEFQKTKYTVLYDPDGFPIFWHRHGFLMQEWQKMAFHHSSPEQTIVG